MDNKSNINTFNVILLCVKLKNDKDFDELVQEGLELSNSAGYNTKYTLTVNRSTIDPKYFIGSGKLDELKVLCNQHQIKALVVNHNLTPVQERNLSKELKIDIIDRTGLILDIFDKRAKSNESVLQVELARLNYLSTRLVRIWTHLERQRGGTYAMGGSGEKQIELDRRMIKSRIKLLKTRLAKVVKNRQTQRKLRQKSDVFSISIVGYTNAGKSTLFNALTNASVYADNRLFATLQTTSRKYYLSDGVDSILSDTVGFISDLPHSLVAAFRATLEETVYADLLLHVVDITRSLKERQIEDVNKVLVEINACDIPVLIVYNKIDLISGTLPAIEYNSASDPAAVHISAEKKIGLDILRKAILEKMLYIKQSESEVIS
ncbi:MAG: GTPase HflX [Neisseriaceae bacterium]